MALKDAVTIIVVFLIFLNAVPSLLMGMGVAEDMGIDPSISGDTNINTAQGKVSDIDVSGGFASTLFVLYNSVAQPFQFILKILFGAELMLISLGVPSEIVFFVFAPKFFLIFGGFAYILVGRNL